MYIVANNLYELIAITIILIVIITGRQNLILDVIYFKCAFVAVLNFLRKLRVLPGLQETLLCNSFLGWHHCKECWGFSVEGMICTKDKYPIELAQNLLNRRKRYLGKQRL